MPGIGKQSAERILAETGIEMEHFQNESRFSSWAGLVPECKESAGKKMSTRIRKGNKYLKAALVECARAAIRNKQSYLYSRYQRIAARRGDAEVFCAQSGIGVAYVFRRDIVFYGKPVKGFTGFYTRRGY